MAALAQTMPEKSILSIVLVVVLLLVLESAIIFEDDEPIARLFQTRTRVGRHFRDVNAKPTNSVALICGPRA